MSNPDLPQEILLEIFSYLPTKSVGKSMCLSRTWNTQLSTSQFIKFHQTRKPHQENLIILSRSGSLNLVTPPMKNDDVWLPRPIQPGRRWAKLFGSCIGLLLLVQQKTRNVFVVNPITHQQVQIPNPPFVRKGTLILYGFGYDRISDDFKVVTLSCQEMDDCYTNVDVYCMKTRVWRTLDYPFVDSIHSKRIMPFLHGALHWYANRDPYSDQSDRIVAFDLATESFHEIPLPKSGFTLDRLVVLRGCLANITIFPFGSVDVWVMNEYGVGDSWVRFHIQENNMWGPVQPLRWVGDEKMLCTAGGNMQCWFVYDLKEGMRKFSVGGQNPVSFTDWMVFEESLVSPE